MPKSVLKELYFLLQLLFITTLEVFEAIKFPKTKEV